MKDVVPILNDVIVEKPYRLQPNYARADGFFIRARRAAVPGGVV